MTRDLQLLILMQREWMTVKPALDYMVFCLYTLLKKKVVGDRPAEWSKTKARQLLNWHPNVMQSQVKMYQSTLFNGYYWIWGYTADYLLMCFCWPCVIANSSGPRNIATDPWIRGSELPCLGESRFVIHHADGRVKIVALWMHRSHTQAGSGGIILLVTFSCGLWDS